MNINKSSWHYRLIDKISDKPVPRNLCPYVRKLLLIIIFCTLVLIITGFVFCQVGVAVLATTGLSGILLLIASYITGASVIFSAIALVVGAGFGIAYLTEKYKERKQEKKEARQAAGIPPKPKSLLTAWAEAKHNKLCPVLEFNDDK